MPERRIRCPWAKRFNPTPEGGAATHATRCFMDPHESSEHVAFGLTEAENIWFHSGDHNTYEESGHVTELTAWDLEPTP